MNKNVELRDASSSTSTKKSTRCRSFHFRYLELCRSKNLTPLGDIRAKNNGTSMLDFYGDKLSVNDWLLIVESLYYDQVLNTLGIRMRKACGSVLEHLDTEKKARTFRQKPVLYTKYIFSGVVEALANCIEFNKNLRILNLEGLPLCGQYVESIAKALSFNESIKEVSFRRSYILDKGCEAICNTIKYLENVEKLNLGECQLTTKGAEHVADMIKIQKISRYTEGWQKSLRYRDVDPDSIAGIRSITLAGNDLIGDDGVKAIVEILKEDVWIKVIDMENCGLTDRAANLILDCLEINHYLIDFNVRGNTGISKFLQRSIRDQLGKDDDDLKAVENQQQQGDGVCAHGTNTVGRKAKLSVPQLREQVKTLEEQLVFERMLRKKAEQLNERLNQQIIAYENQMQENANAAIPEGYVVVKNESLQSIIRERNDFHKIANSAYAKNNDCDATSPHVVINPIHKIYKQQNYEEPSSTTTLSNNAITTPPTAETMSLMDNKEIRKPLKVRKVKSEVKYVDPPPKDNKKHESKSDHEFANERDFNLKVVQFETKIGDTIANNVNSGQLTARIEMKPNKNNYNNNYDVKPFEMDDLSLSSNNYGPSDEASSDSDTVRNASDYQPMKVYIRRNKQQQQQHQFIEYGQGEGGDGSMMAKQQNCMSPRTLFLGLCQD